MGRAVLATCMAWFQIDNDKPARARHATIERPTGSDVGTGFFNTIASRFVGNNMAASSWTRPETVQRENFQARWRTKPPDPRHAIPPWTLDDQDNDQNVPHCGNDGAHSGRPSIQRVFHPQPTYGDGPLSVRGPTACSALT